MLNNLVVHNGEKHYMQKIVMPINIPAQNMMQINNLH